MSLLKKFLVVLLFAGAIGAAAYYLPQLTLTHELKVSGVVEIQEVRLGSKVGGRVADIRVREGDIAEPQQLLVVFEAPELEAQHQQQVSRVAQARANLEKAKNGFRPEEIRQARSELESLQADLALAEQEFQRIEALYKDKKLTRSDYDTAVAVRSRMQGRVAAAQAHYDMLSAGTRAEDIALAEASLLEAQGKLKEIEANLAEAKVVAPERCLVEVVSVRKGDLVPPHQPVVRVLRADDLWVKVFVPETRLGEVRLGQEVDVTIDSHPGRKFRGTVYHIAGESEFTPRNIQSIDSRRYQVFGLKIRVDDTEGIFKSGMSASVTFNGLVPTEGPAARLTERIK
jgi:HlyD family secretion protein